MKVDACKPHQLTYSPTLLYKSLISVTWSIATIHVSLRSRSELKRVIVVRLPIVRWTAAEAVSAVSSVVSFRSQSDFIADRSIVTQIAVGVERVRVENKSTKSCVRRDLVDEEIKQLVFSFETCEIRMYLKTDSKIFENDKRKT